MKEKDSHGRFTKIDLKTRFLARVSIAPNGCWTWTGTVVRGYGQIHDGRGCMAHRVAYELFVGPIPKGLTIDHLCRNTMCVNPKHLEAVTMKENVLRGNAPSARHARATHCKNGHEKTEANMYVFPNGDRNCRLCNNLRQKAKRALKAQERKAAKQ